MPERCGEPCTFVKKLCAEIYGDGKPEESVMVRLAAVEKTIQQVKYLCWVILVGIGGLFVRAVDAWIIGAAK